MGRSHLNRENLESYPIQWTSMADQEEIQILDADRTRDGLAVTFSDGSTTLFSPAFLYSVRHQASNVQVVAEIEEDFPD
jgi:hypothetical protein